MAGLQTITHVPYVEKTLVPISDPKSVENTGTCQDLISLYTDLNRNDKGL